MDRNPGAPPLYAQLEQILKQQIECGTYKKGDFLPTEKELMEKYELSRVTVRQAMTNLVQSGYARARRGIGTDVVYEKVEEQMEGVISFTEEMKKHHIEMQTTYCKMELISPGETVARSLQIPLTEPCYCLKRVRNAVGKPMVYTITYLKKICELPTEPEPYMESLYQYLREEHGIYIESGRDTLEAALPSEEVQKALEIDAQMPILSGHGRHSGRAARFLNIRSAIIREIVISTRWNCKHMTCKKTKPDRSAKSARCESVETKMIGLIGAGNTPMDGRKIKKRKRIQMNLKKKYGNYELHPQMKITGYENEIWDEKKEIIEELKRAVQEKQKEKKTCILSFDLYPGVRKEEMMELANALQPDRIFDIEDCAKDEETLLREFKDYITDDRVFGIMCHKTIDTWFESEKLETMKKAIETERAEEKDTNGGLIVIVGTAAELLTEVDLLVYCDLTRWEVQLRYRSGMPNWHSTNYNDPILTKI